MAREFAKSFYNSSVWKKCSRTYRKSKYNICERCGKPGDIVHHKIYLNPNNIKDPNISLDWNNLELVCIDCHNKEHMNKYNALQDGLRFDSEGNLIKVLDNV